MLNRVYRVPSLPFSSVPNAFFYLSERGKKVMFLKSEKIRKKIKNAIIGGIFVLYLVYLF